MGAELVFWLAAALVIYAYAGYPALLALAGAIFRRPVKKAPVNVSVSMLVAAYNEAAVIGEKVRNALAVRYPAGRLEIVVASDGSSDGTPEAAARAARELGAEDRVRVIAYPQNRGKLAVLNETVPKLHGDIVAFSDASSMLEPDALRHLVENFADPRVGAASGVYRVRKPDEAQTGAQEEFYWKYETFLKQQEAGLGSVLGAHGSLYAVRKALYPYPAPGVINDDYVIPVRILQRGYRVAYEPLAVAYEHAAEMGGFSRRVRIMAGNFRQLGEIGALLWPPRPLALFFFLSHKAARLAAPFAMPAALAANLALLGSPFYRVLAAAQAAFYLLAAIGGIWRLRPKALRLPYYFCMINAAAFPGLYFALGGAMRWNRRTH